MKFGFTGTRHGMTAKQSSRFESRMILPESFHHGSCQGADVEAARIVAKMFKDMRSLFLIVCHPGPDDDPCQELSGVDDERREPNRHFARNRAIVDETDCLIACPYNMVPQLHGGTWYTIKYARKAGKPVTIILPDGTIERTP